MQNMGYCRFENTVEALRECIEALRDIEDGTETLSPSEKKAMLKLKDLCDIYSQEVEEE